MKLLAWRERVVLLLAVVCLFALAYPGASAAPKWREPALLPWDPVWHLPFVPAFAVAYASVFAMPLLLVAVAGDRGRFRRYAAQFAAAIVVAAACFVLVPLRSPHAALGDGMFDRIVGFFYAVDVDGNCFPSLHVAVAFLSAFAIGRERPGWRAAALLWAALIAVSTVLVRQHYVVDVAGGLALAAAVWRFGAPVRHRPA